MSDDNVFNENQPGALDGHRGAITRPTLEDLKREYGLCPGSGQPLNAKHGCDVCHFWMRKRKDGTSWPHTTEYALILSDLCRNCEERPGLETWVGDGGVMSYVHGGGEPWCKKCCIEAQLKHAREMATKIPELEAELQALLDAQ